MNFTPGNVSRIAVIAAIGLAAGCNKADDSKANYESAINDYY